MSKPLALLPAIIWTLDDFAREKAKDWHDVLDDWSKNFVKIANEPEEVNELVQCYLQQSFDQTMVNSGLSLESHLIGRRINIVVVAQLGRNRAAPSWVEVEKTVNEARQKAFSIESHCILIVAGPHPVDWTQSLSGIRETPWLLTDTVSGGFKLESTRLSDLCGSLLDALVLTEKEEIATGGPVIIAFYKPSFQVGQVRLAGFPRLDLRDLMTKITQILARAVLRRRFLEIPDHALLREFEKKLTQRVTQFLNGKLNEERVIDFIIGSEGMGQWTSTDILQMGAAILDGQIRRLRFETSYVPKPSFFEWIKQIYRKFLELLGIRIISTILRPKTEQIEYVINILERLKEIIKELTDIAQKDFPIYPEIPLIITNDWCGELDELLKHTLRNYWNDVEILQILSIHLEKTVTEHFNTALHDWGLDEPFIHEVARGLAKGNLLRFSARLKAEKPAQSNALVTSLRIGDNLKYGSQMIPCAILRVWPAQPPLLLAVSTPIPLDRLHTE